ncbi:hypothetical protein ACFYW9_35725 [Streptomyces sp. NPDC002698]|uniref:tetratricopeptide repeat protein n=1 Tax=Streptomyces sp. NPDC002698 TaxID=3364660 RepID=UPI0036A85996
MGPDEVLAELRRRLQDGLAEARLDKAQLVARVDIARTTVFAALEDGAPVPSARTVAGLGAALKLPVQELLDLQRQAGRRAEAAAEDACGPGQPLTEWDPHELEVHPAGVQPALGADGVRGRRLLPGYVRRPHDGLLAAAVHDAVEGRSRMVVLVGSSSTGKTRACWEAVQPLAGEGWRLWHPYDPSRADAALEELHTVGPRTVVWLNEAQHYLGDPRLGEQVASAVRTLLNDQERGPVLILGTLWPEYADLYTALPTPGSPDRHSGTRELLAVRTVLVPDTFDAEALQAARGLAEQGDRLLADTLTRTTAEGRVAQDLAGAPELLRRYEHATPAARALLEAAMDARRLGVRLHLPQAFLIDAVDDYVTETDYDALDENWVEESFANLARPVHGKQTPLRRVRHRPARRLAAQPPAGGGSGTTAGAGPVYRLADFLEEHGRTVRHASCPPASFWFAAYTHLTDPGDLHFLGLAAERRQRLQWAHRLYRQAVCRGSVEALQDLAEMRWKAGDVQGAGDLAQRAAEAGDTGVLRWFAEGLEELGDLKGAELQWQKLADADQSGALFRLADLRERTGDREGAEAVAQSAADNGDSSVLRELALRRDTAGDRTGAEALAQRAYEAGDAKAMGHLAVLRHQGGDPEGAMSLAHRAADAGDTSVLIRLADLRMDTGDREDAQAMCRRAADRGDTGALIRLAGLRAAEGDHEEAEALMQRAADADNTWALGRLAGLREAAGDFEEAEDLAQRAADAKDTRGLFRLAVLRWEAGDRQGTETLARRAADAGDHGVLFRLARLRERAGDQPAADLLAQRAVDIGDPGALLRLASLREEAGDRTGAGTLMQRAADRGDPEALLRLADWREDEGDREAAQTLVQQAADTGHPAALIRLAVLLERAGDREEAEILAQRATDKGQYTAMISLAVAREETGDRTGAEALARRAADTGRLSPLTLELDGQTHTALLRYFPHGLDPDGLPSLPWTEAVPGMDSRFGE